MPTPFEHVTELGPAEQVCPGKENVLLAPMGFAGAGGLLILLGIGIAIWGPLPLGLVPLGIGTTER